MMTSTTKKEKVRTKYGHDSVINAYSSWLTQLMDRQMKTVANYPAVEKVAKLYCVQMFDTPSVHWPSSYSDRGHNSMIVKSERPLSPFSKKINTWLAIMEWLLIWPVPQRDHGSHTANMEQEGTWGDCVVLLAAAHVFWLFSASAVGHVLRSHYNTTASYSTWSADLAVGPCVWTPLCWSCPTQWTEHSRKPWQHWPLAVWCMGGFRWCLSGVFCIKWCSQCRRTQWHFLLSMWLFWKPWLALFWHSILKMDPKSVRWDSYTNICFCFHVLRRNKEQYIVSV